MTAPDQSTWAPVGRPDLRTFVPRERRLGPLLGWLGLLAVALVALVWLGRGGLAAPDLTRPDTWAAWLESRDTATAVVALLRVLGLGLAWYLVGVTSVSVIAHAARAARLVRVADALSIGPVRVVVQQALGVSLAVGVVATQLPAEAFGAGSPHGGWELAPADLAAGEDDQPWPTVTLVPRSTDSDPAERGGSGQAGTRAGRDTAPARVVASPPVPAPPVVPPTGSEAGLAIPPSAPPLDAAPPAASPPGAPPDAVRPDAAAPHAAPPDAAPPDAVVAGTGRPSVPPGLPAPAPNATGPATSSDVGDGATPVVVAREVRVVPGDHLWGIAEDDLRMALGREPTEREVAGHWRRVIAVNLDRLVVPSNPDLLRPGQVLVLPDVEVAP